MSEDKVLVKGSDLVFQNTDNVLDLKVGLGIS